MSEKLGSGQQNIMLFFINKKSFFLNVVVIQINVDTLSLSRKNCFGFTTARAKVDSLPVIQQ